MLGAERVVNGPLKVPDRVVQIGVHGEIEQQLAEGNIATRTFHYLGNPRYVVVLCLQVPLHLFQAKIWGLRRQRLFVLRVGVEEGIVVELGDAAVGVPGIAIMGGAGPLASVTEVAERLKALEQENRDLRQVNEILRKASAYFAQAELDRRFKP